MSNCTFARRLRAVDSPVAHPHDSVDNELPALLSRRLQNIYTYLYTCTYVYVYMCCYLLLLTLVITNYGNLFTLVYLFIAFSQAFICFCIYNTFLKVVISRHAMPCRAMRFFPALISHAHTFNCLRFVIIIRSCRKTFEFFCCFVNLCNCVMCSNR